MSRKNQTKICMCVILIVCHLSIAYGVQLPSAEFLAKALCDQEQRSFPSLQVEYTITAYKDSEVIGDIVNVHYVRTPEIIFFEEKRGVDPKLFYRWSFNRLTKEGSVATVSNPEDSIISGQILKGDILPRLTIQNMIETSALYTTMLPLFQAVEFGKVSDSMEKVDDHDCWKVTIPFREVEVPGDGEYIVWLDPKVGFCPRRLDKITRGPDAEALSFSMRFSDYQNIGNDVFFPMRQTLVESASIQSVCEVNNIQVGAQIQQSDITIEFPVDIRVTDMRTGKLVD